jgi:2-methylcitrate dehydratase PrpD
MGGSMRDLGMQAPILFELSREIARVRDLPLSEVTVHKAKRVLLDTVGVGLFGSGTELYDIAFRASLSEYAPGRCQLWGRSRTVGAEGAVFFNSLAASALDFDDGHVAAAGHPASLVVPAAMAVGGEIGSEFNLLLSAITIGYEVGTRFSAARDFSKVSTSSSGRWGALASAASAAVLLGLNQEEIMHALSLSALLSPVMMGGHIDVSTGSMAKEGVAWAAKTGVHAARLAGKGFTGPYLFLDESEEYAQETLLSGFGDHWHIETNYHKPYPCCRWIHPAIEACLELKREKKISVEEIRHVEIETFSRVIDLAQTRRPYNSPQAQFNLPFCVAAALFHDGLTPDCLEGKGLENERVLALSSGMTMRALEEFDDAFPTTAPCRVTITTSDEVFISGVFDQPKWGADDPATDEELYRKFRHLTGEAGDGIWYPVMRDEVICAAELDRLIEGATRSVSE